MSAAESPPLDVVGSDGKIAGSGVSEKLLQQEELLVAANGSRWSTSALFDDEFRLLQPIWDLRLGHESAVASPLFPIVVSLTMYALCMVPFTVADLCGPRWFPRLVARYKISPDRRVTWPQVRRAMALTAWNHVLYILPVSVAQVVWTPDTVLPAAAPTLWQFLWHCAAALLVFDFEYYVWHVVHHRVRWLYRNVHAVHHQYSSTSVWVSEYLHPYELFSIGLCTTTAPMLFGAHPLTLWTFMQFSIVISVEDHCGYDLPLAAHRWLPLWGGAPHHDMHHRRPLTDFDPFLTVWDRLFGTYCPGQRAGGFKPPALVRWEQRRDPAFEMEDAFGQADGLPPSTGGDAAAETVKSR